MTEATVRMPPVSVLQAGDAPLRQRRVTLPQLGTIAAVAAILYFAKDVFLPLAIAMLITFALSPLVTRLRRLGLPMVATVLAVVAAAFLAIALFVFVVVGQLGQLAQNLPTFQANILTKLETLQQTGSGNGVVARLSGMVAAINHEIGAVVPPSPAAQPGPASTAPSATAPSATAPAANAPVAPMPVEVVQPRSPVQMVQDLVLPLVSPIATTGLVIVLVIFMLLEREDLRDRFIRLVGSNDLHRTTQVLEEAGEKVGSYLLIQLLVNVIYAVPIGVGLYLIGVPNAMLWGLLTLVLRFVPYIGTALSAVFPLFLAFAVAPGWSAVLWTAALFATVELITGNVIEPWLYSSRTGVTPLAIIVAAIFWTWIWGAPGLVLSTPLTVCLVVLGRHIPQFELFDILFGDEPVLQPHARLYQRLLAGDPTEATFRAEEALEDAYLADYYRDVAIPALLLAQNDRARGVLTADQQDRLAGVAMRMVDDLRGVVQDERADADGAAPPDGAMQPDPSDGRLDGQGYRVACIGGRNGLDDVSAAMLGQAMEAEGADARFHDHADLSPARLPSLDTGGTDCLVLSFLDPNPSRASLLHIRRIKRAAPQLRVGVVIWQLPAGLDAEGDLLHRPAQVTPEKLAEATEIGADFVVTGIEAAMAAAFTRDAVRAIVEPVKRRRTPRLVVARPG